MSFCDRSVPCALTPCPGDAANALPRVPASTSRIRLLALLFSALAAAGCDQINAMNDQPRYDPLEPTDFFADGTSARPAVVGAVPRAPDPLGYDASEPRQSAPPEMTSDLLAHGQTAFQVYCIMCHGRTGFGDGIVVARGYPTPPTFHDAHLRGVPREHIFNVITNGLGKMPPYSRQISIPDRWAIVAYVRALQLSQHAPIDLASTETKGRLTAPLEVPP